MDNQGIYGKHCVEETVGKICPISHEDLNETYDSHPRKRIFISHSKDNKSIPYCVEDFKDWLDFQESKGDSVKIPHCNIMVSSIEADNIRNRVKFHLEACDNFPDITYKKVLDSGSTWVKEYIESLTNNSDDLLKLKIHYFCGPLHFSPEYLLNVSDTSDNSDLRLNAEELLVTSTVGAFVLRCSTIVDTDIVKNYVLTLKSQYGFQHIPFRHRYGHGYFAITHARRYSTLDDTLDNYIGSGIFDVFDHFLIDLKSIVKVK